MACRWCGVRRVFLCMFMFQYSPGNTVNNATGFYTYREQDELYAKGRTIPGSIVTKAKGGQSNHNFGLAIDVFPIWQDGRLHMKKEDDAENIRLLKLIAHIGIEEGLAWGGHWRKFKDYPHFELKVGKNMA